MEIIQLTNRRTRQANAKEKTTVQGGIVMALPAAQGG